MPQAGTPLPLSRLLGRAGAAKVKCISLRVQSWHSAGRRCDLTVQWGHDPIPGSPSRAATAVMAKKGFGRGWRASFMKSAQGFVPELNDASSCRAD